MLPLLEELYLGGSVLYNLPFPRHIIPELNNVKNMQRRFRVSQISNWDIPNLGCILSSLGPKLKVLELPNEFRISPDSEPWYCQDVNCISKYFPELRGLILPAGAATESRYVDIFPLKFEVLALTNTWNENHGDWVYDLVHLKVQHRFPCLRKVLIYHRHAGSTWVLTSSTW